MKRYKLLKDLPDAKTGDIFQRKTDDVTLVDIIYKIDSEEIALAPTYHIEDMTNFDEWFEEYEEKGWKPKIGDEYWYIADCGIVVCNAWRNGIIDNGRYEIGNCYRTEEDAEHAKKVQIAQTKIKRSSDFVPDWNDKKQEKWCVVYDYQKKRLSTYVFFYIDRGAIVYYETEEDTEQAIKELEPEYLLHFGIK